MTGLKHDRVSSTQSSSSTTKPCLFLRRLPPEVRNKIYDLCFPTNTTVYPDAHNIFDRVTNYDNGTAFLPRETVLSLARTCHLIRNEVVPMYFGSNMFSFRTGYQMYQFMFSIGKENRAAIRQLEFVWGYECPMQQVSLLGECVNLQRLHIGVNRTMMPGMGCTQNIWKAYGVGTLRAIRGLPSLDLKVRAVGKFRIGGEISAIFEGDQPTRRGVAQSDRFYAGFWFGRFDDGVLGEFQAVLKEELGRDREEGARKVQKPKSITRVKKTKILGVEVNLVAVSQEEAQPVVLGRRGAAVKGEAKRRAAAGTAKK